MVRERPRRICWRRWPRRGRDPNLSEDEIAAIATRLEAGEYLDDYYRSRLFPSSKESAASYSGKTPPGVVLAETMAVPFHRGGAPVVTGKIGAGTF